MACAFAVCPKQPVTVSGDSDRMQGHMVGIFRGQQLLSFDCWRITSHWKWDFPRLLASCNPSDSFRGFVNSILRRDNKLILFPLYSRSGRQVRL
jgi:hypothetical protein